MAPGLSFAVVSTRGVVIACSLERCSGLPERGLRRDARRISKLQRSLAVCWVRICAFSLAPGELIPTVEDHCRRRVDSRAICIGSIPERDGPCYANGSRLSTLVTGLPGLAIVDQPYPAADSAATARGNPCGRGPQQSVLS